MWSDILFDIYFVIWHSISLYFKILPNMSNKMPDRIPAKMPEIISDHMPRGISNLCQICHAGWRAS
jgi:hypothetical protein